MFRFMAQDALSALASAFYTKVKNSIDYHYIYS